MYNALKHLKQSSKRDLDGLDTKILKLAAPLIADPLTYVHNLCIMKNTFPCAFKRAKVIPIYKSGSSTDPSNNRPISILSVLSKTFEKHIKHLLLHLNRYNLLHPYQSGFRKKHSCQTVLTSLVEQWLTNIDNDEFNGIILVDLKKKKRLMLLIMTCFCKNYFFMECRTILWNGFNLISPTDNSVLLFVLKHLLCQH